MTARPAVSDDPIAKLARDIATLTREVATLNDRLGATVPGPNWADDQQTAEPRSAIRNAPFDGKNDATQMISAAVEDLDGALRDIRSIRSHVDSAGISQARKRPPGRNRP